MHGIILLDNVGRISTCPRSTWFGATGKKKQPIIGISESLAVAHTLQRLSEQCASQRYCGICLGYIRLPGPPGVCRSSQRLKRWSIALCTPSAPSALRRREELNSGTDMGTARWALAARCFLGHCHGVSTGWGVRQGLG